MVEGSEKKKPRGVLAKLPQVRPITVALTSLVIIWGIFQWKDPTPPPVLDQLLVFLFGVWFTNEAAEKSSGKRKKKREAEEEQDDDDS